MPLEDFTTFTENDANSRFTVSANTIAVTLLKAEIDHNVVKDYGAAFFGDLPLGIEWDAVINASSNNAGMHALAMTNTPAKSYAQHRPENDDEPSFWCQFTRTSGAEDFLIIQTFGTGNVFDIGAWGATVRIYFTLTRSGTTFTLKMYSDSGRTTLTDTLAVTSISTAFQHLFAVNNPYDLLPNGPQISGDIKNYELLDGTLGLGVALMSNAMELAGGRVW